jgi:hypothetical protein
VVTTTQIIHDENGLLVNENDIKRTDELQPSMSPTPETPSLPDSGAFSDDKSAEDDIDDQEENHVENKMLFNERERLEETQLSTAITEAELFSYDESFSDEESIEDFSVIIMEARAEPRFSSSLILFQTNNNGGSS